MKVASAEAYKLFHDGAVALSQVESNGIRIDLDYLDTTIRKTKRRIRKLEARLQEHEIYKQWKGIFKEKTKLGSSEQLGHLVFDVLKYQCKVRTEKKKQPKTDEAAFSHIDLPFVKEYFTWKKFQKLLNTYLKGILVEVVDGYLHPFFHLHTVVSYRGSSSHVNFQNYPIRNAEIGEIIRKCFIPRDGHVIVEADFSGIEVRVSACYNKDPTLISYINDPTKDMHRDMAAECYILDVSDVDKQVRYCAKNMYVFPQFYGSFYIDCARGLWDAIDKMALKRKDGTSLKDHLASKGITSLGECDEKKPPKRGTFEYHIKEVEEDFWGRRFPVYKAWKEKWYRQYKQECGFTTLTGFRINGLYRRNEVINLPVQGSAFHCLLWCLIQLQRWLVKNKMKSMILGQIHDSLVMDVHRSELQDVLNKAKEIMTAGIRDAWAWVIVPLEAQYEVGETNWHSKRPWYCENGIWKPQEKK